MAKTVETAEETAATTAPAKKIVGDGKAMYRCTTTCYHRDTYYREGDTVIPPDGGDLPADYFVKA